MTTDFGHSFGVLHDESVGGIEYRDDEALADYVRDRRLCGDAIWEGEEWCQQQDNQNRERMSHSRPAAGGSNKVSAADSRAGADDLED